MEPIIPFGTFSLELYSLIFLLLISQFNINRNRGLVGIIITHDRGSRNLVVQLYRQRRPKPVKVGYLFCWKVFFQIVIPLVYL